MSDIDHNYIVRMSDNALDIVGPFANREELRAWGKRNQDERGDDPRWQSIRLADDTRALLAVRVWTSTSAPTTVWTSALVECGL